MNTTDRRRVVRDVVVAAAATVVPLMLLLATNAAQIADTSLVWATAAVSAGVAALIVLVVRRTRVRQPGLVVGAFGYTFFFNSFFGPGPLAARLALWLVMGVVAVVVVRVLVGEAERSQWIVAGVLTAVVSVCAVLGATSAEPSVPEAIAFEAVDPVRRPNIYVFVLDGLARPDVYREEFPTVDVDAMAENLAEHGFDTSEIATVNYSRTHISVPSMLMGEYQTTAEAPLGLDGEWAYAAETMGGNNRLVSMLRTAGYSYWHSESGQWGHFPCDRSFADRCLNGDQSIEPETASAIWSLTPFGGSPWPGLRPQDPTTVVDSVLTARAEAARSGDERPVVMLSHIISPHHPYRFDADCGSMHVGTLGDGWQDEYRQLYADQTTCLFRQLDESMDRLIADDPEAIVLLLSDHGSQFGIDWVPGEWSDTDVRRRFTSFRSVRLPESCSTDDPRAHTLVNVSRLLTWCLTDDPPDWLDSVQYTQNYHGNRVSAVPDHQRSLLEPR